MKKLLIILFVLPCFLQAQYNETLRTTEGLIFQHMPNILQLKGEVVGPKSDTIPVILIVIDTLTGITTTAGFFHPLDQAQNDRRVPFWIRGYSVREKHNTGESEIDPGFYHCIDKQGNEIPCFSDYWKHLYYLDQNKKPLLTSIIVWQSKELN